MSTTIPRITDEAVAKPELVVVNLDDLNIDHTYQRELNQRFVERLLRTWDELAADALTVNKRADGKLYLVNGQHRAGAAKLAGEVEMLALQYEGLSVEEESALRLRSNHRRPDTPLERFHAQLGAKEEETLIIAKIIDDFGTQINRVNNKESGINCVVTVEQIFRMDLGVTLRQMLRVLKDSYGTVEGKVAQEPVFKGTASFLKNHGQEISIAEFRRRIREAGIDDIMRKARAHKSALGGSLGMNYYRALVEVWNYRRSEKYRIEWKRIGTSSKES